MPVHQRESCIINCSIHKVSVPFLYQSHDLRAAFAGKKLVHLPSSHDTCQILSVIKKQFVQHLLTHKIHGTGIFTKNIYHKKYQLKIHGKMVNIPFVPWESVKHCTSENSSASIQSSFKLDKHFNFSTSMNSIGFLGCHGCL